MCALQVFRLGLYFWFSRILQGKLPLHFLRASVPVKSRDFLVTAALASCPSSGPKTCMFLRISGGLLVIVRAAHEIHHLPSHNSSFCPNLFLQDPVNAIVTSASAN